MLNKEQIKDFMSAMKENGDTDPMQVSLENITVFADTQGVEVSEVMEFCQVAHEMNFMETFSAAEDDDEDEEFSGEEDSGTEDTPKEDTPAEDENFSDEEFAQTKNEPPKEEPKLEDKPKDEPPKEDPKPEDKPTEMSEEEKVATKEKLTELKDKIAQTSNLAEGDNLKEFIQCCGQVAELGKKIAKPEEFAKTVFDKPKDEPKPEDKTADEKPKDEGKPANFSEGGEKPTFDYLDSYLK